MGKISTILNERDIRIFEIIKKFGWLREDYIAKYLGFDWADKKTKNNLNTLAFRLKSGGFIVKQKIIEGYPGYWTLGKNGAEFINSEEQKLMPLGTLRHNDMVADLAIDLMVKEPTTEIITEHELKQELFGSEAKKKKLPDLILNSKVAIEVEISRKNDNKLALVLANYATSSYEQIIYYTNSTGIANIVNKLVKNNPKFKFKLFKDSNILVNENYTPIENYEPEPVRSETGQFVNSADEKLRKLGAIQ